MNGDVRLRVEGLMLERLVQRALNEGARFRRIQRSGPRTLLLETDPDSAAVVLKLCERFSITCEVVERRGRDAMLRRLKQRSTLLAGILTCLAIVSLVLSRVWLIDVELTGTRTASIQPIEQALSAMGVRPGMARADVNPVLLENALSAASPDFSFVGVRLQGVRLLVEVAPAVTAPEVYELDSGRDLVAACDGVVLSVNVLAGAACVAPGDTVVRGQVLIRGDERVSKEESRSIAALGSIVARTWYSGSASLPVAQTEQLLTGRSSLSSELRLLDFAWPLVEGESYPSQESETEILPIGGLFLPLEIHRTTIRETRFQQTPVDSDALYSRVTALAWSAAGAELSKAQPADCEIADRWIEYTLDAGKLYARAVYETHTDIAVTRDVLYQQGG